MHYVQSTTLSTLCYSQGLNWSKTKGDRVHNCEMCSASAEAQPYLPYVIPRISECLGQVSCWLVQNCEQWRDKHKLACKKKKKKKKTIYFI